MKEKNVVEAFALASSSTRSEDGLIMVKKLLESMGFVYCICEIDFKTFAVGHELVAEKYINEKMDFVLLHPPYNVRWDRNADSLEHDVFTSEDATRCD